MPRRKRKKRIVKAVVACTCLTGAASATAQTGRGDRESKKLTWDYARVRPSEEAATALLVGGAVLAQYTLKNDGSPNWRGGILFDGAASSFVRPDDSAARNRAAHVSDMMLYGMIAFPYLDAGGAWGLRGSSDVAGQMALINTESFAVTGFVTQLVKGLVKRERPWVGRCAGSNDPACVGSDSFLSGHTSMTFTSAGLTCAHHEALSLYGNAAADAGVCVAALGVAATTGALRVVADKHYASDVFAGAALGLASGYLLPKLLHYSGRERDKHESRKGPPSVAWSAAPSPTRGGAVMSVQAVF
jgi:membrane-associated phospholipid phosphatase